jgi:hypothetical protein
MWWTPHSTNGGSIAPPIPVSQTCQLQEIWGLGLQELSEGELLLTSCAHVVAPTLSLVPHQDLMQWEVELGHPCVQHDVLMGHHNLPEHVMESVGFLVRPKLSQQAE